MRKEKTDMENVRNIRSGTHGGLFKFNVTKKEEEKYSHFNDQKLFLHKLISPDRPAFAEAILFHFC